MGTKPTKLNYFKGVDDSTKPNIFLGQYKLKFKNEKSTRETDKSRPILFLSRVNKSFHQKLYFSMPDCSHFTVYNFTKGTAHFSRFHKNYSKDKFLMKNLKKSKQKNFFSDCKILGNLSKRRFFYFTVEGDKLIFRREFNEVFELNLEEDEEGDASSNFKVTGEETLVFSQSSKVVALCLKNRKILFRRDYSELTENEIEIEDVSRMNIVARIYGGYVVKDCKMGRKAEILQDGEERMTLHDGDAYEFFPDAETGAMKYKREATGYEGRLSFYKEKDSWSFRDYRKVFSRTKEYLLLMKSKKIVLLKFEKAGKIVVMGEYKSKLAFRFYQAEFFEEKRFVVFVGKTDNRGLESCMFFVLRY